MKLLVVIPHFCGGSPGTNGTGAYYGSAGSRLRRLAALNEAIVALHRNFGPSRIPVRPGQRASTADSLDIVIVTVAGHNVLDRLDLAEGAYTAEFYDGPPMMLPFEAQRILRERVGQYDFYGMLEDDLIVHDPAHFEKLQWFVETFGERCVLQPHRCEVSKSGAPAKFLIDPKLGEHPARFVHEGQQAQLSGDWHGKRVDFITPSNPHSGGYFVTEEQLRHWIQQPWFHDRDVSWVGPLESAATLSLTRSFDVYKPVDAQGNFLEIEHYGVRYANQFETADVVHGDALLLNLLESAIGCGGNSEDLRALAHRGVYERVLRENSQLRGENTELRAQMNSRSRLFQQWIRLLRTKAMRAT